jgi:Ca2+-binding EF-hand superfamily protein
MGNNLSIANKRFEGGKLPFKHWNEDVWPSVEDLYDKFNLDQSGGYEIFKAYISIGEDNAGSVTSKQCQDFFGGRVTNYTKRVFFHIGTWDQQNNAFLERSNETKDKLTFEDFTILIWNYCSYSALHLSRQLFEIYDVSLTNQLERPDLESMYRMMYDCDDHEEWCIAKFPLDGKGFIDKKGFIQHCSKQKHLIQPAINYQR